MIELIVFPCTGSGQAEKIVLVAAYGRTKPTRFEDGLRQHNFRMANTVTENFLIEIRDSKFGQTFIRFYLSYLLGRAFVTVSAFPITFYLTDTDLF